MVKEADYLITVFDKYSNQSVLPIFQGKARWESKQLKEFFNTLINNNYPYYSEIKLYANSEDISVFGTSLIIDGQQRMTSYSLCVLACCAYCKKHDLNYNWEEDFYYKVIINKKYSGTERYRLKLHENDNIAYQTCVENLEHSEDSKNFNPKIKNDEETLSIIIDNYNYLYGLIDETNIKRVYYSLQ